MMKTIHVSTGKEYDVHIGPGLLDSCGALAAQAVKPCKMAVICDDTVAPLYLHRVIASLTSAGFTTVSFTFPAGEASKNISTLSNILEFLAESGLTRSDCIAALGGGVTGDMAGFAAGVYMRGISFIQLPTTLLAAVDSSVGGKTAIDLQAGKNLAGVFLQPKTVICDTAALSTLSPEILACGMAEAIKTAVLNSPEMFSLFESPEPDLDEVICRCVAHKADVVAQDEFETGLRKTLNLGHTLGHAVEKLSNYTIPHGYAVSIGMALIARACAARGICTNDCCQRIISALESFDLPTETEFSAHDLAQAAVSDKKRQGSSITMVLIKDIGRCILENLPISQLEDFIGGSHE